MKKKSITSIKKNTHAMVREVTVSYKPLDTEKIHVDNPAKVARFVSEKIGNEVKESFILLCINNKNMVVSYSVVSVGTVSEAIVHPREVFLPAVLTLASGVIVAHNHPSGNHLPSKQDIETTKRLAEAGRIMGIPLVDHIIVGFNNEGDFYSMKENGYI